MDVVERGVLARLAGKEGDGKPFLVVGDKSTHDALTERGLLRTWVGIDDDGDESQFWSITPMGHLLLAVVDGGFPT